MTRLGPRKAVSASYWEGQLKSARDFHSAARDALPLVDTGRNCGPLVSQAVLAAIAYVDAVTARKARVVNQQDHGSAPRLLRAVLGNTPPDAPEERYRRMLGRKNEVQYGVRHVALEEARQVVADLDAFAEWAEGLLR